MLKTSTKIFACAIAATLSLTGYSQAQIALSIDDPTIEVGTSETILISGSGADQVNILDLILIVEDGGAAVGGFATEPQIVDVVPVGGFATGGVSFANEPFSDNPLAVIVAVNDIAAPVTPGALSPFVSIAFDTSALSVGDTFTLDLSQSAAFTTELGFDPDGAGPIAPAGVVTTFPDDGFLITVVGVPEPSAVCLLAGMFAPAMLRRRRS